MLIVEVHVDDLIVNIARKDEVSLFKGDMQCLFSMSDLRTLRYYLDLEVSQGWCQIVVMQAAYVGKFLERADIYG